MFLQLPCLQLYCCSSLCVVSLLTRAVVCSLFVDQYFFGLGHQATVNSLKIEAGFVGVYGDIRSVNLLIAGVLVGMNTLASQVR